jgi:hypothetical protein
MLCVTKKIKKEDYMGRKCRGKRKMHMKLLSENLNRRDHMGDLGIYRRII